MAFEVDKDNSSDNIITMLRNKIKYIDESVTILKAQRDIVFELLSAAETLQRQEEARLNQRSGGLTKGDN